MWFLFQRCQEGTWLKDTRYSLQSFPLARRRSPPVSSSSFIFFFPTDIARSRKRSRRIITIVVYIHVLIRILRRVGWNKFWANRDWFAITWRDAPGNRRSAAFSLCTRHTPGGYIPPSLPPFISPYTILRIVSFTLLFYLYYYPLLFIMFYFYSLYRYSLLAIVYYPCYYACFNYGNEKNMVRELPQLRYVRMCIYICVCVYV